MTPQQPGALVGAREDRRPGSSEGRPSGPGGPVRADLATVEAGSWLLAVPAGTCLVLVITMLLGWA